MDITSPTVDRS